MTGRPRSHDLETPTSVLAIAAHPDDAEFLAGATLAKWARGGATVHHLILTDGSKGTWDAGADIPRLVERRQQEQRAARKELGASGEVVFLDEIDGELTAGVRVRGRVAREIRRLRPQVILGHDPWKRYRLHPDHRVAGELCVEGIVAGRDPFFHPELLEEGLEPHRPSALLLFEPDEANHYESVSEADLDAKLRALEAHESQMETTHFYRIDEGDPLQRFRERERRRVTDAAEALGLDAPAMVEPYHLIVDQL